MEMSSLPMKGWQYWRIFETHGYWALISNTELSFVPRGFLFIRIRKKHRKIMEQSCHKNNTILFKNAHYYARWYSIYMSKNKQYPNFTTFSHFQQKNYQLYSESDCLLIELLSYSKCEAPFFSQYEHWPTVVIFGFKTLNYSVNKLNQTTNEILNIRYQYQQFLAKERKAERVYSFLVHFFTTMYLFLYMH